MNMLAGLILTGIISAGTYLVMAALAERTNGNKFLESCSVVVPMLIVGIAVYIIFA